MATIHLPVPPPGLIVPFSPAHTIIADFDGDGHKEIILANFNASELDGFRQYNMVMYEHTGDTGENEYELVCEVDLLEMWESIVGYPVLDMQTSVNSFSISDFDRDGRQEIVGIATFHYMTRSVVFVIENDGDNSYQLIWNSDILPTVYPKVITKGPDLDNDGRGDFALLGNTMDGDGSYYGMAEWICLIYESVEDNSFRQVWEMRKEGYSGAGGLATGNVDKDHLDELLIQYPLAGHETSPTTSDNIILKAKPRSENIYKIVWRTNFGEPPFFGWPGWAYRQKQLIGSDLDNDGAKEIIYNSRTSDGRAGEILIYEQRS